MPRWIQRRRFLQLAGATLGTLGLSQVDLHRQAQRYHRALAQPTRRKLALLVGINDYPGAIPSLRGCLTDVELQYYLLVHRYGFNPQDIVIVSDRTLSLPGQPILAPPTRQQILDAFETHLIQQAQENDVVVFHYSGHGSFVQEEDGISEFGNMNGTIVPYDARLEGGDRVDDIMGKTLFLLSLALPTDYVTLVLDSCHSGGGVRGTARIRALDTPNARPSERELAYQQQWMERLNLDAATLRSLRQQGIARGVALGSAQISQLATDAAFDGFHAGAFTYLLTRYLWQMPAPQPLANAFVTIARNTRDVANTSGMAQDPVYATATDRDWDTQPVYLLSPTSAPAEAVVRSIEGDQVSFWLGGLAVHSLASQQAVFSLVDAQGNPTGEVLQTERTGLVGRGTLQGTTRQRPQQGQLMREQIRGVPTQLTLRVGVAPSLGAQETELLAKLAEIPRIAAVRVTSDTPVDYLLGQGGDLAPAPGHQGAIAAAPTSLGLLTPVLTPVPETFGPASESAPEAITRLRPRLKMLLAGKMLSTLINGSSSPLRVNIAVQAVGASVPLVSLGNGSVTGGGAAIPTVASPPPLVAGTEIQVQVQNQDVQDLYMALLSIASTGEMAILHPVGWDAPEAAARLPAGQTQRVPDPDGAGDRFRFVVQGPAGFFELLVLVSAVPLRDTLRSLQTIARNRGTRSGNPLAFAEGTRSRDEGEDAPVDVVDALLRDLDQGSRGAIAAVPTQQRIDAQRLAAYTFVLEVTD